MNDDNKPLILIADDVSENIDFLAMILRPLYKVAGAADGLTALQMARSIRPPDLVLLDVEMPQMDGYEVCRQLKCNAETRHIPVIFVTARSDESDEQRGFELGACDYIIKPFSPALVRARVKNQLALHCQEKHLESLVRKRTVELNDTRLEIIRRLGRAGEFKDGGSSAHVIRMSWYARILAEQIGQPEAWCDLLFNVMPLHDIGKIGIPDSILLKPGELTEQEREIVRKHPEYGAEIIGDSSSAMMTMAKDIAIAHHEHWDGEGYPKGLKGEEIPLCARITAIVDVFDALCSKRPYKNAWPDSLALSYIRQQSGKKFDPYLVGQFLECLPKILAIKSQHTHED